MHLRRLTNAVLSAFAVLGFCTPSEAKLDRSALGVTVATCRLNASVTESPLPCLKVKNSDDDLRGYAVLREPFERQRTILAALSDIAGIEDSRLLGLAAPNFFALAWAERSWVLGKTGTGDAPPGFALAINPKTMRSQDRLHVHIGCLEDAVQAALGKRTVAVNPNRFAALNFKIRGWPLWAMRVDADDLRDLDPIQLLAANLPGASEDMGNQMLVVVREQLPSGKSTFVLLTNRSDDRSRPYSVEPLFASSCSGGIK